MVRNVSISIPPDSEHDGRFIRAEIARVLHKEGVDADMDAATLVREKKSIDARHGRIRLVVRYRVYIGETPPSGSGQPPRWRPADGLRRVLVIGAGPAGLFGALTLLEHGITPVIIERGAPTDVRKRDIAAISTRGEVDADSNYCFGEGGAGTFSDGKLYTRSKKRGDVSRILRLFHDFGADERILTDAHPHIGTDRLPAIIAAMRTTILKLGGEIYFNTRCTALATEPDGATVRGVRALHIPTGEEREFAGEAVLLATGHSAADIYALLSRAAPAALEAKAFAVGVRVEHPRATIDAIQYHGRPEARRLGAAEYRFTSQQDGRGTYSFCMCPGGFVVPSATGPGQLVVNGMSAAGRNSAWSNAAFVVEVRPEDIPAKYAGQAREHGAPALAGLLWRGELERLTYAHGSGQKAPAQRMSDFLARRGSDSLPASSYAPGLVPSRLDEWLPAAISERLAAAFREADTRMKGFLCPDALLIAGETRTSTPVRILRGTEDGQCVALRGLFPAGEGSGYAGGIMSSAMDGVRQCGRIAEWLSR